MCDTGHRTRRWGYSHRVQGRATRCARQPPVKSEKEVSPATLGLVSNTLPHPSNTSKLAGCTYGGVDDPMAEVSLSDGIPLNGRVTLLFFLVALSASVYGVGTRRGQSAGVNRSQGLVTLPSSKRASMPLNMDVRLVMTLLDIWIKNSSL
eukprot:768424-Hanusia_phi.AAC.2